MSFRTSWFASLALGAVATLGTVSLANATPTRSELNSGIELSEDGWSEFANGSSQYKDGIMHIPQGGYDEWWLYSNLNDAYSNWGKYVDADRGWWVELRMKLDPPQGASNHGQAILIRDGRRELTIKFGPEDLLLVTKTETHYKFNTTNAFHVYRVQRPRADVVQVLIDGNKVLEVATPEAATNVGASIIFGSLDEFYGAYWDYISYDTAAPGAETQDADDDGIALSQDLCPALKDDGKDSDHDRIGDTCDKCPNDPDNDVDGDGLCADVDVCPSNAQNPDVNNNGKCDDDECKRGLAYGFEFAPAGSEGAQWCTVNDLQCLCYNQEAAHCSAKESCLSTCDCRWAGLAASGSASASSAGPSASASASASSTPSVTNPAASFTPAPQSSATAVGSAEHGTETQGDLAFRPSPSATLQPASSVTSAEVVARPQASAAASLSASSSPATTNGVEDAAPGSCSVAPRRGPSAALALLLGALGFIARRRRAA